MQGEGKGQRPRQLKSGVRYQAARRRRQISDTEGSAVTAKGRERSQQR